MITTGTAAGTSIIATVAIVGGATAAITGGATEAIAGGATEAIAAAAGIMAAVGITTATSRS